MAAPVVATPTAVAGGTYEPRGVTATATRRTVQVNTSYRHIPVEIAVTVRKG